MAGPRFTPLFRSIRVDRAIASISDRAARFYFMLLAHADAHGRADADPTLLNADVWPLVGASAEEVRGLVEQCRSAGLIEIHERSGSRWIQVSNWTDTFGAVGKSRQKPASAFPDPAPESLVGGASEREQAEPRETRDASGSELAEVHDGRLTDPTPARAASLPVCTAMSPAGPRHSPDAHRNVPKAHRRSPGAHRDVVVVDTVDVAVESLSGVSGSTAPPEPTPQPKSVRPGQVESHEAVLARPQFAAVRESRIVMDAWRRWLLHAGQPGVKAKAPSGTTAEALLRRAAKCLQRDGGDELFARAVDDAIANNWQGVNPDWVRASATANGAHVSAVPKGEAANRRAIERMLQEAGATPASAVLSATPRCLEVGQ